MYTLQIGGEYCILTIYVDDILVTAPDKKFLARIKKQLMERFTVSDLGEVSLILGMKITRDRVKKTLSINQTDTQCPSWSVSGCKTATLSAYHAKGAKFPWINRLKHCLTKTASKHTRAW